MLLKLSVHSQPSPTGWRTNWRMGATLEIWTIISPCTHFSSSTASAWCLLGVGTLILNSLIHHWFANPFQTGWSCRWLQGRRGGDLIRGTEGKSPPTASQAQPLGVCLYHMAPHSSETQTWQNRLWTHNLVVHLAVISHLLGTALGGLQHMPA